MIVYKICYYLGWRRSPYSKRERLETYRSSLKMLIEHYNIHYISMGFCFLLVKHNNINLYDFPEIMVHRPIHKNRCYWFPVDTDGYLKRKKILENAIKCLS